MKRAYRFIILSYDIQKSRETHRLGDMCESGYLSFFFLCVVECTLTWNSLKEVKLHIVFLIVVIFQIFNITLIKAAERH